MATEDSVNYYLPTLEQFELAKAEVRARWTPEERLKRLRVDWRPGDWSAPEVEGIEGDAGGEFPT